MVAISASSKSMTRLRRKRKNEITAPQWIAAGSFLAGCLCYVFFSVSFDSTHIRATSSSAPLKQPDPNTRLSALADDVESALKCAELQSKNENTERRLEGFEEFYDDGLEGQDFYEYDFSARQLFCRAVEFFRNGTLPEENAYQCASVSPQTLLSLWSDARSKMETDLLYAVLEGNIAQQRTFVEKELLLWLPVIQDDGQEFILSRLNTADRTVDDGGVYGLELGHGQVWVEVGSGTGLTAMAISLIYPDTHIFSIEAAAPNWLIQKMNWMCNKMESNKVTLLLAGVGPVEGFSEFAPMRYYVNGTMSVHGWSRKSDTKESDFRLKVPLTPWHALLKQMGLYSSHEIDVLHVDCEGCEYNFIPALTDEEFSSIRSVMGEVHWGYIPLSKKPSSYRARQTHEKLCSHENFARLAKECCAFPTLTVSSSRPDSILVAEGEPLSAGITVSEVAGELCDDFTDWKVRKHLETVDSDSGWFKLTDSANDDEM